MTASTPGCELRCELGGESVPLDDGLLLLLLLLVLLLPTLLLLLLFELLFCGESEVPCRRGAIGSTTGLICGEVGVTPGDPNRCCG